MRIEVKKGDRYGKLIVIKELPKIKYKRKDNGRISTRRVFLCECDCGNKIKVLLASIRTGNTKSCGCLNKENGIRTHGKSSSPEYSTWSGMIQRCLNKNNGRYDSYGGRGIKVCKRWMKFKNFYNDMGDRPKGKTLDRADNDGNYCPENCRWATVEKQMNNTRRNRFLEYNGENLTIPQWSRKLNIKIGTLATRIKRGWSLKRAFTTPTGVYNKKI